MATTYTVPDGVVSSGLTLADKDLMNVLSGGSADTITVDVIATMNVSSGGIATNICENGGAVNVADGAVVEFVENVITGATVDNHIMTVHSNTTANENVFGWGGRLQVYDGGVASGNVYNVGWGGIEIYSGGKATGTTANVGSGWMTVNEGGYAENTIFNCHWYWGGHLNVLEGAAVTGTTVTAGYMIVKSGGEAEDTMVVNANMNLEGTADILTINVGTLNVYSNGVANGVNMTSATMNVNDGGTVNDLTLTELNTVNVLSGATVNGTVEVGIYNTVNISSGAEPVTILENGGAVNVADGAVVEFVENVITGATVDNHIMTVHSNTTANENVFGWGGRLQVYDGGVASGNVYNVGWGGIEIYSGGKATGTTANVGSGWMTVSSGGSAENTIFSDNWYWGGHLNVLEGAAVTGTTVTAGYMIVKSGGEATDTLVVGGGMNVEGAASDITVAGGALTVNGGGQAANVSLDTGSITVQADGTLTSATVNVTTTMNVNSGGVATGICENGGAVNVDEGATAEFVENLITGITVGNNTMTVHKNTVASGNLFTWGGLKVYDGGIASGNEFAAGWATIEVNSGGRISDTVANIGSGWMTVSSGGYAENTIFSDNWYWGGHMNVLEGAAVTGTTVNAGYMIVKSGGEATDTLVAGGNLNVDGGGTAAGAELTAGTINIAADGMITGVTVHERTTLNFSSGATGDAIVEEGGVVNVAEGATVTFAEHTITGHTVDNYTMTVHKNTTASDNLFVGGNLKVYDGGIASGNVFGASWAGIDVYSGGKVTGTTAYVGSGYFNISSGGSAENTIFNDNWYWGGHMNVCDGASVTGTTVNAGYMIVKSGGEATDTLVAGGNLNVDGGGTAAGAELTAGTINIAADGMITGVTVHERTTLNFSSGATGDAIVEEGGVVNVAEGATVTFAEHTITGHTVDNYTMTVHKNTTASDNLFVGGSLKVYDGYASGNEFAASWAIIEVNSGGRISDTVANIGSGWMTVNEGGYAENTIFNCHWYWGGGLNVLAGASVTGTTVNGGNFNVSSGADAKSTLLTGGAFNLTGTAEDVTLTGGGMNIGSGAVLTGEIAISAGASINVSSGGTFLIDLSTMMPREAARVSGIGRVGGTKTITVKVSDTQANGKYLLSADAAGFNGTISVVGSTGEELGTLTVDESVVIGETAYHLAVLRNTLKLFIGIDVIPSEVYVDPEWSDLAEGAMVSLAGGGTATIGYDAFATGDEAAAAADEDDGLIRIQDGSVSFAAKAPEVLVSSGAALGVASGVEISGATVLGGGIATVAQGGAVAAARTETGGELIIASGATVSGIVENGGYTEVEEGASVSFESHYISSFYVTGGGRATLHSGTTAGNAAVSGGTIFVSTGGIAEQNVIYNGGETVVSRGGIVSSSVVSGGGKLDVRDGASVESVYVGYSGELVVSGGTATGVSVAGGARLTVYVDSDTVVFGESAGTPFAISGGTATDCRIEAGGKMEVSGGMAASGTVVSGTSAEVRILDGASAADTTVGAGAALHIESNGMADGVTVRGNDASLHVSGGTAENVAVSAGGRVFAESGTAVDGLSLDGGIASVSSGATVKNVALTGSGYPYGELNVFGGGSASGVSVSSGGYLWGGYEASVSDVGIGSGGQAYLHGSGSGVLLDGGFLGVEAGGAVTGTTVGAGGSMYAVNSAGTGTMLDTVVQSGGTINNFGRASGTVVMTGGTMGAYGRAVTEATVVQSGAEVSFTGGKVRGLTLEAGAAATVSGGKLTGVISLGEGASLAMPTGILELDPTALGVPGATPLVNDYSLIEGSPELTLTVSSVQAPGQYILVNGLPTDFSRTLTVTNSSGIQVGTISVGETIHAGNYSCTLGFAPDTGSLTLDVTHYFNGRFDGGTQALFVKEYDSALNIYKDGDVWADLTLDDGWTAAGAGDFNGDGADDILRVHTSGLVIGDMSNVDGSFSPQVLNFKGGGWSIHGAGDFDGDGVDDVLVANPTAASETVGLLGYWKDGTTWTLINGYSPEWEIVSTGDFNGDGKCDMLWRNSFIGAGDLTYNAFCTWIVDPPAEESDWRMVSVANPDEWSFLCSGDFDGDGTDDIAMINDVGVVGIWGIGDGYLNSWSILSAVTPEWTLAGVGDFDGDGTDDIAWCNTSTNLAGYWQINDKELTEWHNIANLS